MGGKGGGGGDFYQPPPDTSGYATPDQAAATLAAQAPLDLSGMQQAIDVNKAANLATAPTPTAPTDTTGGSGTDTSGTGNTAADAVLAPPNYWFSPSIQPTSATKSNKMTTTPS